MGDYLEFPRMEAGTITRTGQEWDKLSDTDSRAAGEDGLEQEHAAQGPRGHFSPTSQAWILVLPLTFWIKLGKIEGCEK